MKNRWNQADVPDRPDPVEECIYGSRLLGAEPELVLHGGGNTSVKTVTNDITGAEIPVLSVKGSGHNLAAIGRAGFTALRLNRLEELLKLDTLSDKQMLNELRCARLEATAPDPSVETLLHAMLPHQAVLHSHADAILTLTNLDNGAERVSSILGDGIIVVPYCMPGFDLARTAAQIWRRDGNPRHVGMILLHHGLVTFGDSTREAYDRHIELITHAEEYLASHAALPPSGRSRLPDIPPTDLTELRHAISEAAGRPMILRRHTDAAVADFVRRADLHEISQRGPLTPDHVIRTKRLPLVGKDVKTYVDEYHRYFDANASRSSTPLQILDPAPRVILDPELGLVTVGPTAKDSEIAYDIYRHTIQVISRAERLSGYRALPASDIFDVEYWDLEQAKLQRSDSTPVLAGEVALVTGAASGIGRACAQQLLSRGAAVLGVDIQPDVAQTFIDPSYQGVVADVTDLDQIRRGVRACVEQFGGLDILVAAAGIFPPSQTVAELNLADWTRAMDINATSVAMLLAEAHPLLRLAPRQGRVVAIGSRNVTAPGPGAAAYSASKAALNQLVRVTALEWAGDGIRINTVHPDAVFDTGLWTEEVLRRRASHYGMSVDEYKKRNLLRTEVRSETVGRLVAELCTDTFQSTTGAQIPVDGGNERVV